MDFKTATDGELAVMIRDAAARSNAGPASAQPAIIGATQQEAEHELLSRLGPRIRLYGLRHLRDSQAAADLTQQVLVIALESLREGRVREPEKLVSFVLSTCRMVVLEQRRGSQRRERLLAQHAHEIPAETEPPSDPLDLARLAECMRHLAERERSVITMSFHEEHSSARVAEQMGLSVSNVRVIRHRSLERLRICMHGGAQ